MRMLVARQRDAGCIHPVMFGGPQQECSPACANIQETIAGLEHQFAADMVEFGFLRLGQCHAGFAVIGARINAARVQPQGIESIGNIVMELDLRGIFDRRMCGYRTGPVQQARPPAGVAFHRIAGQQLACCTHEIAHCSLELQLSLDIVFRQGANLAGIQVGNAGPLRK